MKRIELDKDASDDIIGVLQRRSAVVEAVALGDVFISPHGLCVGPVEAGGDFFQCGWSTIYPRVLDRCAMVDVPYPRGIKPDGTIVFPTHPSVERLFDVVFKLIDRTTKVLNAVKGLAPLKRVVYLSRNYMA